MRMESMVGAWEGAGFDYIGIGGVKGRSSAEAAVADYAKSVCKTTIC